MTNNETQMLATMVLEVVNGKSVDDYYRFTSETKLELIKNIVSHYAKVEEKELEDERQE
ncbi:hypothetical protein MKN08_05490 [Streptococcus suis]|nr:hypothetical protein [Streptococcus suis]MDG3350936.1 hypothetical protein [Streptococcus suis]NQK51163.1 hypothetical protein [Streptococcus suis]HEL1734362.1 hypothetical protein [Streptococcus suis]HEM4176720.1 hypothetical protein [Streptococcus suis]